jgi:hypothetical protein
MSESFDERLKRQSREKAERWLNGEFEERGPYTQVMLDEDTAREIAQISLVEDTTISRVANRLIKMSL